MKLVYFRDPHGNFGDDLNPWLWDRLLPGLIDDDPGELLIGMGTILEPWFAKDLDPAAHKVVLGAGGGMTVPALRPGADWSVHCVRGPLTARYLGLDPALGATDPAMCLREVWEGKAQASGAVGFMPHHSSLRQWDWSGTCERAGLTYVDPRGDPLETVAQIAGLRLILTEAMHGAIVADALRVPWFPLQINPLNYVGKWHDWGATVRMPIHFKPLPELYDPLRVHGREGLRKLGVRRALWELRRRSGRRAEARAVHLLQQYAEHYDSYLSEERDLDEAIGRFREALERFRRSR